MVHSVIKVIFSKLNQIYDLVLVIGVGPSEDYAIEVEFLLLINF